MGFHGRSAPVGQMRWWISAFMHIAYILNEDRLLWDPRCHEGSQGSKESTVTLNILFDKQDTNELYTYQG